MRYACVPAYVREGLRTETPAFVHWGCSSGGSGGVGSDEGSAPFLTIETLLQTVRQGASMFIRSSLVQVRVEPWFTAIGLVLGVADDGVTVRLGNGVIITLSEMDLAPVEYMQGSGCAASFPEEMWHPTRTRRVSL